MSEVKRYCIDWFGQETYECDCGPWVKSDDYIELQARITELEKDAARLHDAIMNIQVGKHGAAMGMAYREGHRDARHAAAELVVAMQSEKGGV